MFPDAGGMRDTMRQLGERLSDLGYVVLVPDLYYRNGHYEPIEMPRNSPVGFVTAFFATFTGFALIWHIWWLVVLGLICAYATFVVFAWRDVAEFEIPADEVARIDRANRQARADQLRGEVASGAHP